MYNFFKGMQGYVFKEELEEVLAMDELNKEIIESTGIEARFEEAPKFYCNRFEITLGPGDVTVWGSRDAKPIMALNLSFTVAKSLSLTLGKMIAILEQGSDKPIMTSQEIEEIIQKAKERDGK